MALMGAGLRDPPQHPGRHFRRCGLRGTEAKGWKRHNVFLGEGEHGKEEGKKRGMHCTYVDMMVLRRHSAWGGTRGPCGIVRIFLS